MTEYAELHQGRMAKETAERDAEVQEEHPVKAKDSEKNEKLKADLDEILDEIEDVLEENAADFAASYQQKGGE